ncbi:hypothetical protein RMS29_014865 [Agrobacterium rosae]|uniref:PrgI family protein n=1 Tax=Agrobacterium rosae TaxID=1972867 RepID=A0ABU4W4W3_9HYPH|nr:hypothetical protein [Agrobacterium rosae]MDX8332813.1 hypothetical protein [Agrobacterium rosae]
MTTRRPELLMGRIILFVAFLFEYFFWRIAASRLSNVLYGSIIAVFSLPFCVLLGIPPIYSFAVLILAVVVNPTQYLLALRERRMLYWSTYEYDLATYELYRVKKLRNGWRKKSAGSST